MATGQLLPVRINAPHGATNDQATTAPSVNATGTTYRCRVGVLWLYSTTANVTAVPSGWQTLVATQTIGSFRCTVYYYPNWAPGNTNDSVWTVSPGAPYVFNSNDWEGFAANPLANTPITASGTTTSASIPTMTVPNNAVPFWFWAARWSASSSSQTFTLPADLVSAGNVLAGVTTAAPSARCGVWMTASTPNNPALRSPSPTGAKVATLSATPTAWSGIAFALNPAEMPGNMMAA